MFGIVPNNFENSLNFGFRFSQNFSSVSKSSVSRDRCIWFPSKIQFCKILLLWILAFKYLQRYKVFLRNCILIAIFSPHLLSQIQGLLFVFSLCMQARENFGFFPTKLNSSMDRLCVPTFSRQKSALRVQALVVIEIANLKELYTNFGV